MQPCDTLSPLPHLASIQSPAHLGEGDLLVSCQNAALSCRGRVMIKLNGQRGYRCPWT